MGFCSLRFDLQKTEYTELYGAKNACFARILTYCATHALPYLCTPTGVSCLSSELFRSLPACRKGFFDTLKSTLWRAFFKSLTAAQRMPPPTVHETIALPFNIVGAMINRPLTAASVLAQAVFRRYGGRSMTAPTDSIGTACTQRASRVLTAGNNRRKNPALAYLK